MVNWSIQVPRFVIQKPLGVANTRTSMKNIKWFEKKVENSCWSAVAYIWSWKLITRMRWVVRGFEEDTKVDVGLPSFGLRSTRHVYMSIVRMEWVVLWKQSCEIERNDKDEDVVKYQTGIQADDRNSKKCKIWDYSLQKRTVKLQLEQLPMHNFTDQIYKLKLIHSIKKWS